MPVAVESPTWIVRVDVAVPFAVGVIETRLKLPVAPVGSPNVERLTAELKPFSEVTVMVDVPDAP